MLPMHYTQGQAAPWPEHGDVRFVELGGRAYWRELNENAPEEEPDERGLHLFQKFCHDKSMFARAHGLKLLDRSATNRSKAKYKARMKDAGFNTSFPKGHRYYRKGQ